MKKKNFVWAISNRQSFIYDVVHGLNITRQFCPRRGHDIELDGRSGAAFGFDVFQNGV
jgi:hypothetical protein